MPYEYWFDADACWYAKTCSKYKKEGCDSSCIRYMEMHYLMNNSGIPQAQQYAKALVPSKQDIRAFTELKDIKDDIVNFVANGENVYIYSENLGNGKTTWAIKLMQKFFDQIWAGNGFRTRGIFLNVPTFLMKIKEGINRKDEDFETLRENLLKVDLVIWDDIASTKLSDFDHGMLLSYIDSRKLSGLANIYTGNLADDKLADAIGNRLASRVWNDSQLVHFVGADRRGVK